jgi:DNA (cytosine-5)-methyltransferase 1
MFTLNTIEKHAVCYAISSYFSHAMLSNNPNSGIYEAKTSRCLDLNGGNPACHQGGMIIVYEGQSCSTDTDTAFTLQAGRADDHHICDVVYPITSGALCAKMDRGLSGQDGFNDMIPVIRSEDMDGQKKYVLRRLTPLECARLQGFPDWWTDGVEGSDSNKYKMWGNGIALPCAADVIGRIAKSLGDENE